VPLRAAAPRRQTERTEAAPARAGATALVRRLEPRRGAGFALSLADGGADSHDQDFERY
jgi:hypothetical protein